MKTVFVGQVLYPRVIQTTEMEDFLVYVYGSVCFLTSLSTLLLTACLWLTPGSDFSPLLKGWRANQEEVGGGWVGDWCNARERRKRANGQNSLSNCTDLEFWFHLIRHISDYVTWLISGIKPEDAISINRQKLIRHFKYFHLHLSETPLSFKAKCGAFSLTKKRSVK